MSLETPFPSAAAPRRKRQRYRHPDVDRDALGRDLAKAVEGEVRFDGQARALYATDGSNYREVPLGVVYPASADDVLAVLDVCRRHGAPVLPRGGGTSLAGQCCNVAVVLDFTRHLNRILDVDPVHRIAVVEPGVVLDVLRGEAEKHHLTFPPDPSTHGWCTLGGMIGNDSCGVHSILGGRTQDNVHRLDVVTYRGERFDLGRYRDEDYDRIVSAGGPLADKLVRLRALRDSYAELVRARFPKIPRRVSGYSLDALLPENGFHVARSLVGSEATCVMVLQATVRLVHSPPARSLLVIGYPSIYEAADACPAVLEHEGVVGLEGIDEILVDDMKKKHIHPDELELLPKGCGWLLVELGGETREESDGYARRIQASIRELGGVDSRLYDDREAERRIWEVRESGLGATARVPGKPDAWEGWEDSAVPPEKFGDYLRDFRKLLDDYGYHGAMYGHFGQGCLHTRIDFDLHTRRGVEHYRKFAFDAADLVVRYGGSLSGEHGDGQSRGELLERMFGPELIEAFEKFKDLWDPDERMNPGKVVRPFRLDDNLRLGPEYRPREVGTVFAFAEDDGSFARATERCVGVGKCRREDPSGTMCPSWRATRDERHDTRGRTHLLHEMLRKDGAIEGGFQSDAVRDALDLCLSCKGCKADCPMDVDVATYKAEFLYHHYQGRVRPRQAYTLGLMPLWARIASFAPRMANLVTHLPGLSWLAKRIAGVATSRSLPRFATTTFKTWMRRHPPTDGVPVVLWADSWTDHFDPDVGIAAVEVLEAAGFAPIVLQQPLCCGRPLYDFGMLDVARKWLLQTLDALGPYLDQGLGIVVLEPSCASTFRDELVALWPDDARARQLAGATWTLGEWLTEKAPDFHPELTRRVHVHPHCHERAVLDPQAEKKVLDAMGCEADVLDTGCCGMAGVFGFEDRKVDVSLKIGEERFLPTIRAASTSDVFVVDGYSCRLQMADQTRRRGLHLAQVLQMALRDGPAGPRVGAPERAYVRDAPKGPWISLASLLGLAATLLLSRRSLRSPPSSLEKREA